MGIESIHSYTSFSNEQENRAKTALFIMHTINDMLHSAEPKDIECCQGEMLDTLKQLRESFESCIRETAVRHEVAAEAAQDGGELVERIGQKVHEIRRIHGSSQVADQLTLNVHRDVMEAAVMERLNPDN